MESPKYSPIVIGGVGGSGTRVVAEVAKKAGVNIGRDINKSNDNLMFTVLFLRPDWYNKARKRDVRTGVEIIRKKILSKSMSCLTINEIMFMLKAIKDTSIRRKRPLFALKRMKEWHMYNQGQDKNKIWGWKEPNSMMYAKVILECYDNAKYIHVVRNGLDMAYSSNKRQLKNWGKYFDINEPDDTSPNNNLKYWVRSNSQVISQLEQIAPQRFRVVQFDSLCKDPYSVINNFLNFLGVEYCERDIEKLCKIPKVPKSLGRHMDKALNELDNLTVQKAKKLYQKVSDICI
jgi:hypothetical protein